MTFLIILSVLSILVISVKIFLPGQKKHTGIALKTGLSAIFLTLGIVSFFSSSKGTVPLLFLLGLLICMIGDILLEIGGKVTFVIGVTFFGGGHLLYIAGYLTGLLKNYGGEGLRDRGLLLFAAVCLIMIAGFYFFKLKIPRGFFLMTAGYMIALSLMCAMAFLYAMASQNPIFALIAGLFVISDASLTIGLYEEKKNKIEDVFCLYPYYISQLLLAFIITAL